MSEARAGDVEDSTRGGQIDYQWLPIRREMAIETKSSVDHIGANGLAVDIDGNWLMLTQVGLAVDDDSDGSAVLWRSSDRGESWSRAVVLPHVLPNQRYLKDYDHYYQRLFVTRTGRILIYVEHWRRKNGLIRIPHAKKGADLDEDPPGRRRMSDAGYLYVGIKMSVVYSDDKAKTWRSTYVDGGPLQYVSSHACGGFHESENGDLILPVRGWIKEAGPWGWTAATGYVRSSNAGETWDPPRIIFKDDGQRGQWYNETAVLPSASGPWFAVARMNPLLRVQKPGSHGFLGGYRSFSNDKGNTWMLPESATDAIAYPRMLQLNDGSILMAASRWGPLYMQVSYDNGYSSAYGLEVPRSGGGVGAWLHPDEKTLVVAHPDISDRHVMLTYFSRQPTSRTITRNPPKHPGHRWTMRDLKNLHFDKNLKPYCASVRCTDGTIVVVGVTGGPVAQVIAIRTMDPWHEWSSAVVVAEASKYTNIYPICMAARSDGTLMIVCTEADDRFGRDEIFPLGKDQWGTPTLLRTLVSHDSGKTWKQVDVMDAGQTIRCLRPASRMVMDGDGQLLLPVSALDHKGFSVCGLLRWEGDGHGWSSFRLIAQSKTIEDVFDHPAVVPLGNDRLLCVFRANLAEYRVAYKNTKGTTLRQPPLWCSFSVDAGQSWTTPAHLWSVHYPQLLRLPDGALMLTNISGSHLQYRLSYNRGASWSFEDTVIHYPTYNLYQGRFAMSDLSVVVVDDHTLLGTYFCNDEYEGGARLVGTWFRALPAGSFESRERGL